MFGFILNLSLEYLQKDLNNKWCYVLFRLIREILYSLQDNIDKYIMEKKYCSVYELSSHRGIFILFFLGIFKLFDYYLFHMDNYEYFNNFDYKEILVAIGIILFNIGLELSVLFTIKIYTPCHAFIIDEFVEITSDMISFDDSPEKLILMIICYIIVFFFSLVFNEIIEINCFGLSDNTRRNIMKREKSEDLATIDINEDNRNSLVHLEMNDVDSLVDNEVYN